ncbi:hypothetical protein B8W69_03570 [Mycobacterium vulneris]|uniref:Uncharacterized protein n=2 Tax=Mycolicibacterium vulneris TaxID=547163 RepID=A0A1X2LC37_9MYCO|nr:hypothetical protein B8W69_03570 [Mycolicibacterium vulneris]
MFRGRPQRKLDGVLHRIQDDDLRRGLIEVFALARRRAEAREIDVVVLAARRLACVYQLLVANGMHPLEDVCEVISDRFLDVPGKWKWSRVLLLDDSVVVGTTLLRIYAEIEARLPQGGSVECVAVCIDSEQKADYLVDAVKLEGLQKRSSAEVARFAEQVVATLFAEGMPLFSDFPTTTVIHTTEERWLRYLSHENWYAADVTAPVFGDPGQLCYTQVPTDLTVRRILGRLPQEVAQLIDIMKLRSYVRFGGDRQVRVRIVPIAMLSPCSTSQLDAALIAITNSRSVVDNMGSVQLASDQWSPVARHRLVQMYVATCVLEEALAAADQGNPELATARLDPLHVRMYFGSYAPLIDKLIDGITEGYRGRKCDEQYAVTRAPIARPSSSPLLREPLLRKLLSENREIIASTGTPIRPSAGEVSKVGLIFGHAICSVFGQINEVYEAAQRSAIRAMRTLAEYEDRFASGREQRVLSQGITLRDLTAALLPDALLGSSWDRALITLGIDTGNDLGIIVPVTQYDETRDVVYRCYRIGETASLAMTPLTQAAETGEWDAYCRAANSGFPLKSVASTLATTAVTRAETTTPVGRLEELKSLIEKAVPGDILSQSDGEVVSIRDGFFSVQFDATGESQAQTVQMPLARLSDRDGRALQEGSLVVWTVFQRDADESFDRTSRVRVRHEPPLDDPQLAAAVAAVHAG